jgi:hypothetical protein
MAECTQMLSLTIAETIRQPPPDARILSGRLDAHSFGRFRAASFLSVRWFIA